ncbi:MAG: alpha/beta fold hydrolase [Flavobacteriia bacterium]|nr:alpha/beta fold hydrolase [Flavobacteriia bacterium]OIP46523.1 MAG: alpha/beta hydrolase [Flavobacteriaceae bacterium CG2_30_31_66]PIV96466.1 MAG: alpha/beta hydrolase [Flavobacteriaceae bacterium CG17_big_fil_post_rev_8_21_14_2_50_31_13]PIX14540.1 MAG: alpha/beta hydrolase [Flavobacteriaceae bacterium CG_4_8_14_3_um_filter_31_8]PIY15087.1 MAG: alpha/beta hydrolase [Flavobacteriaceae bacterium CG_4_10_14_3_um_filter_31_253]PIZ09727.1 MAG: alpha/beta hydrolase [Flavobacteriaceae bacterium CG
MPVFKSDFLPTIPFRNSHFNTMYRPLFMKDVANFSRKRLTTWDHDFIDLDFSLVGSETLVLLIHGLEGSSESHYMISTTNHLKNKGLDTVCFNLRSCSGEDNLLLSTYHSGKTEDIDFVVNYLLDHYDYKNIVIIGFSLGGNLTLKYLGEKSDQISPIIKGGIAVSVPIDIASAEKEMDKLKNKLYLEVFFKTMKTKVLEKAFKFPEFQLDKEQLFKATKFKHLEHLYTVPVFGFESPEDYWEKASSKPFIPEIKIPTLLINAKDDTFLSKECYPIEEAQNSAFFFLEIPNYGGHVGFMSSFKPKENTWLEKRIARFIKENIQIPIL